MFEGRKIFGAVMLIIGILLAFYPFCDPCAVAANPPDVMSVAVLDFQASGPRLADLGAQTAVLLNMHLSKNENLIVVERQELEKLLNEQELGASEIIKSETAAQIGSLTGAKILITGRVFESSSGIMLAAKIMSTETSRVYGEQAAIPDVKSIETGARDLAERLANTIRNRKESLLAAPESKADLLAKLKRAIGDRKLPSVAVKISERHFGQPVADPAAETELISVLQQLGFIIIDQVKSVKEPDILISGEGFSELGARRGNLYSCKSRVEIRAYKAETGDLIAVDRQTETAVDLSERIAGKKALQNAASKLIERLAPKL